MQPGEFGFLRAGLDVQGQRDAPSPRRGTSRSQEHQDHCSSRMATSGDRSMPEIVGMMRRIGSRMGG